MYQYSSSLHLWTLLLSSRTVQGGSQYPVPYQIDKLDDKELAYLYTRVQNLQTINFKRK